MNAHTRLSLPNDKAHLPGPLQRTATRAKPECGPGQVKRLVRCRSRRLQEPDLRGTSRTIGDDGRPNLVKIALHWPPLLLNELQTFFEAFSFFSRVDQLIGVVRNKNDSSRPNGPRYRQERLTVNLSQGRNCEKPSPSPTSEYLRDVWEKSNAHVARAGEPPMVLQQITFAFLKNAPRKKPIRFIVGVVITPIFFDGSASRCCRLKDAKHGIGGPVKLVRVGVIDITASSSPHRGIPPTANAKEFYPAWSAQEELDPCH